MILVDTSVVLDQIRTKSHALEALFRQLPTAMCGIVRAEVLSGSRSSSEHTKLVGLLNGFQQIQIIETYWDFIGDLRSHFETRGFSFGLPDVAIAGITLVNGITLCSRDKHHRQMQKLVPQLQLFVEPP